MRGTEATLAEPITLGDIEAGLRRVIPDDDKIIVLHSGLWRFGHAIRPMTRDFLDRLLDLILRVTGPDRTLVVPAYTTGDYPRTKTFDTVRTLPATGALAIALLRRQLAFRTASPMNSYLVVGPQTEAINACPCLTAWGPNGVMAYLAREGARFVTLGAVWHESCSYYHHSEELVRVPYRYFKRFEGELFEDGRHIGRCVETLYVKSLNVPCDDHYAGPEKVLRERGLILDAGDHRFILESALIGDIVRVACELLAQQPYYFVRNREAVQAWVADGKVAEIESLDAHQTHPLNSELI